MSSSSEPGAHLRNGPESPYVIAAIDAAISRDMGSARQALQDGAASTSWADVAHRLDVAGRALVREVDVQSPEAVDWADALVLLGAGDDPLVADDAARVHAAWCEDHGVVATIDLVDAEVDIRSDVDRTWPALMVLTWLVDRAGYPPQVVV